jgi:AraC-like DNA-binding protein
VVTDGRRIERISRSAFDPFAHEARRRIEGQRELVRRHAVIAPFGLIGTIMAGFFPLLAAGDHYRVFTDGGEAFGWLGRPAVFEELEALVDGARGQAPVVTELARWLAAHLRDATITTAARALGRSSRSLQRELGAASTSFRRELDRARVSAARTRLADGEEKLAVIAREVGCVSGSTFSELFRRVTGETPSEFRTRSRR